MPLDLGAKTKGRSPSYPSYNWVQRVTTNAILKSLKRYLQPDVPFFDPPRPAGYPPYFYEGKLEEPPIFHGYDLGFHDYAYRDPSQYPETGGNIHWNASLWLVGIDAGSNSYTPVIQINWGFTVDKSGNTTNNGVEILGCGTGGCNQ